MPGVNCAVILVCLERKKPQKPNVFLSSRSVELLPSAKKCILQSMQSMYIIMNINDSLFLELALKLETFLGNASIYKLEIVNHLFLRISLFKIMLCEIFPWFCISASKLTRN